ncbi:MAG: META domain-containing protein [Sulfitobacter sp.]
MMKLSIALVVTAAFTACKGDETLRSYGAADQVWKLTTLNGAAFAPTATLQFPETGLLSGKAPCNSYRAEMSAPYPWFEAGPIAATKLACPDLAAETAFFDALAAAREAEVLGDTMVLSNTEGLEMVFKASE